MLFLPGLINLLMILLGRIHVVRQSTWLVENDVAVEIIAATAYAMFWLCSMLLVGHFTCIVYNLVTCTNAPSSCLQCLTLWCGIISLNSNWSHMKPNKQPFQSFLSLFVNNLNNHNPRNCDVFTRTALIAGFNASNLHCDFRCFIGHHGLSDTPTRIESSVPTPHLSSLISFTRNVDNGA